MAIQDNPGNGVSRRHTRIASRSASMGTMDRAAVVATITVTL